MRAFQGQKSLSVWLAVGVLFGATASAVASETDPTDAERAQAARATASSHPDCSRDILKSFYWEIGDVNGVRASGRVGGRVNVDSIMNVGSASKWLYAAYAIEKFGYEPEMVPYLNFTSGYSNFDSTQCPDNVSIAECGAGAVNADEARDSIFHYDGGHMQQHAILSGLGNLRNAGFAREVKRWIGPELELRYKKPQPAGGAKTNALNYAIFLRKLLVDSPTPLALGPLLGADAVCTIPGPDCVASPATSLPEAWHYSLGHWVEDDPATTPLINRAYSSPGLFGFYPWVDFDRKIYGILARNGLDVENEPYNSALCGRMIRLAWKTGVPQVGSQGLQAGGRP
jgi:hypothetical protein